MRSIVTVPGVRRTRTRVLQAGLAAAIVAGGQLVVATPAAAHAALATSLVVVGAVAPAPAHAQVPTDAQVQDLVYAAASPADCDGNAVIGIFRRVGSGASFTFHGRVVELQNESALDTYSRAEITSGRQAGDKVWVDRSFRRWPITFKGVVSDADAKRDGWKQCGPFDTRTQSVINSVFAARACVQIPNAYRCGAWWVD